MRIYGLWKPSNVIMVEKVKYAIGNLYKRRGSDRQVMVDFLFTLTRALIKPKI